MLSIPIIIVDVIGFIIFWYIWRNFEKKRNSDQILGLLFTTFCIIDITWALFPMLVPNWMLMYVPSCWLVVITRCALITTGVIDIHRIHKKELEKFGRRKEDKTRGDDFHFVDNK